MTSWSTYFHCSTSYYLYLFVGCHLHQPQPTLEQFFAPRFLKTDFSLVFLSSAPTYVVALLVPWEIFCFCVYNITKVSFIQNCLHSTTLFTLFAIYEYLRTKFNNLFTLKFKSKTFPNVCTKLVTIPATEHEFLACPHTSVCSKNKISHRILFITCLMNSIK